MTSTKYGNLPLETKEKYKERLIGRIFKILPMKEEESDTLSAYMRSLLFELVGCGKLIEELEQKADFLILLSTLENLIDEDDIGIIRSEVFKCIDIVKKL